MPQRRSKKTSKPTVRKAKRVVAKAHKKAAAKNMDTFFLKAKTIVSAVPAQGITVSNYMYMAAQLLPGNLLMNTEFQLYRLQYDKFRVNKVTMKVTPKANVLDALLAQSDANATVSGNGVIHTCIDRDGVAPSSIAAISRYPSYKKYSLLKPFSRSYSIRWPTGIWLDCQDPSASGSTSIFNTLGLGGSVTMYAENLIEDADEILNEPWAEVEFHWDVVFCGKTSASLSATFDEDGNVVAMTLTPQETFTAYDLTPLHNVRGTVKDTRFTQNSGSTAITDKQSE